MIDKSALKLAFIINELRAGGTQGIAETAAKLNELGLVAPSGKPFSFGTTRRILHRLATLGLAKPLRTKSEIAKLPRMYRGYVRKPASTGRKKF